MAKSTVRRRFLCILVLFSVPFSTLAQVDPSLRTAIAPPPESTQPAPHRGIVAAAFYYWYRYVTGPDGVVDPLKSDRVYAYDAASGQTIYKLGEDFPEYVEDDPDKPYKSIVDYNNPDWYKLEFRDMSAAGIDIAVMNAGLLLPLCRYADGPDPWYAYVGVPVAAQTVRDMQAEGLQPPRLALLWDGSTAGYDLTQGFEESEYWEDCNSGVYTRNAWAAWIQVREFFRRLGATPEERSQVWGTVDGAPLIVAYERHGAQFSQEFWDWLHDQFEGEFGVRPFIALTASWAVDSAGQDVKADAFYYWDASLLGPRDVSATLGGARFLNVGPGFDTSWSPYRAGVPIRPREDGLRGPLNPTGTFYDYSWQSALVLRPKIVMIETWNERFEATSIARSPRYNDYYIRKTRMYSDALRRGIPVDEVTVPLYPRPMRYRVADSPLFSGRRVLRYTAANDSMLMGLPKIFRQASFVTETDGGLEINRDNRFEGNVSFQAPYLLTERGRAWSYVHVHVADTWGFDLPGNQTVTVRMAYIDDRSVTADDPPESKADFFIEYDSWDPGDLPGESGVPPMAGGNPYRMPHHDNSAFQNRVRNEQGEVLLETASAVIPMQGCPEDPQVKTVEWLLPLSRFGNRQNTGADFRIAVRIPERTAQEPVRILSIEVEGPVTMGPEYNSRTVEDVMRGLRIASGLGEMDQTDLWRLDETPGEPSLDRIDLMDVARLVRQMAGLEPMGVTPVPR